MLKSPLTLSIFLIYSGQQLAAQNKFYIKPSMETKASTSYCYEKKSLPTEYFIFEKQKISWPHNFTPLHLGIFIGYHLNKKNSFEFGITQEAAMSGYNLYFFRKQFDYYSNGYIRNTSGTAGIKIPIFFYHTLYSPDSLKRKKLNCSLDIIIGISQFRQPKGNPLQAITGTGADNIIVSPNIVMSCDDKTYSMNYKEILYTVGLSSTIHYKNKNILNIALIYEYGRKNLSQQIISVNIKDNNTNSNIKYNYNVYSRGSGFVLQLSRNIQWSDFNRKGSKSTEKQRFF